MQNFLQKGETLNVTAPYAVASGAAALVGLIFGVAVSTAASGANVDLWMKGVFALAKDTSTFSVGDVVYWDNTAKAVTSTATSNKKVGIATLAALTGDATANVYLPGQIPV